MNTKKGIIIIISTLIILFGIIIIIKLTNRKSGDIILDDKYYNKGEYVEVLSNEVNELKDSTYVLFTYNNYCSLPIPCDKIFKQFMEKYKIDFLSITFEEFKKTYLYETVKFAPSVIIIKNGKIIDYLRSDDNDDLEKYQDVKEFKNWISKYIKLKK